jgi:5,10-methenyltetrahydromethanopterin hydrogenase
MSIHHKDKAMKVEMKDLKVVKKIVVGEPVSPMNVVTNEQEKDKDWFKYYLEKAGNTITHRYQLRCLILISL